MGLDFLPIGVLPGEMLSHAGHASFRQEIQEVELMVKTSTASPQTTVYVVDDDDAVRGSLVRLLHSAGLKPRPYATAEQFLNEVEDIGEACILLDVTMPRMSGHQVQAQLNSRGVRVPVITVSAHDDERTRETAKRMGALLFLRKPVDDQALLDAIHWVTSTRKR